MSSSFCWKVLWVPHHYKIPGDNVLAITRKLSFIVTGSLSVAGAIAYLATHFGQTEASDVAPYLGWVLFGLTIALCITLVCYIWRNHKRSLRTIKRQLRKFEQDDHIGIIMVDADNEAAGIVRAINRYLTHIRLHFEKDQICQKEMELQIDASDTEKFQAEAIIDSIPEAVVVVDQNNELLQANHAAQSLFDFSLDLNIHMPVRLVLDDDDILNLIHSTQKSPSDTIALTLERFHPITNKLLNLKIIASNVSNSQKEVIGVVLVVHDMTAEKEIARMKDDILSSVSHELKTPLASIRAYAEMLIDGEADSEETHESFCEIILEQSLRLGQMIDDILNISKIESGRLRVRNNTFNVNPLIGKIEKVIKPHAQNKNINIIMNIDTAPLTIHADENMIFQAILNLVSNAVKYSDSYSQITINTFKNEIDQVVIEVHDQGIGIPQDAIEQIFEKFYRIPEHHHMAGGTGLGLNLVQQIIETLHQGEVQVESITGEGSIFTIKLPAHSIDINKSSDDSESSISEAERMSFVI